MAIAAARGEIDIDTVGTLSEHLGHLTLAGKNPQRLVIDLAGVSFIDASGLASTSATPALWSRPSSVQ